METCSRCCGVSPAMRCLFPRCRACQRSLMSSSLGTATHTADSAKVISLRASGGKPVSNASSVQKSIKTLVLSGVSAARSLCWNYIVLHRLPVLRFLLSQRCSSQGLSSRKLPVQKPQSHTLFPREPSLRQCVNIICIYM